MNLQEHIKKVLREEVQRKYSKPTENMIRLVIKYLDDLFLGSEMNYTKSYESTSSFEWCKNGKEIMDFRMYFNTDKNVYDDRRKMRERDFESGQLLIPQEFLDSISSYFPIRRNYLRYLVEEWFEDNFLDEVNRAMDRNDIYVTEFTEHPKEARNCVPPITKPENVSMEEMRDYVKKNTLYSYTEIDKKEEEHPGWTEELYLSILRQKEYERLNPR